jgi:RHS repeat-associated protein
MYSVSEVGTQEIESKHIYVGEVRIVTKQKTSNNPNYQEEYRKQYYYHGDHLGSAQLVTDWEGKVYEHLEYTPYGELWIDHAVSAVSSNPTMFRFTGKELDQETGLYYYGARYLDPKTSRWISADPAMGEYIPVAPINDQARKHNGNLPGLGGIFNLVNFHTYHYAGNNPIKLIDPDGRMSIDDDPPSRWGVDLNLLNPNDIGGFDEDANLAASRIQRDATGTFVILGHGSSDEMFDNREGKMRSLSPSQLARLMKKNGYQEGDTVILLACDTGKTSDRYDVSFAQRLADKLGSNTVVKAPDNLVYIAYWTPAFVKVGPPGAESIFDFRLRTISYRDNYYWLKTFEHRNPRERRR